ncbi:thiamine biosynthesis protein ThiS [Amylibacter marinus]|uniref:Thiamine biosynthesis protein ThiS n=1 Tax=Amylibacter marinus TaxID=1475483 RepID=A0ABQ5VRX7_9RHOB|nr:sulfur carrier protein ThiS [Amylibacter marinus]GLQ34178.1 thiamine biosynthesis protein ThiS [Amylibacter marinus]
MKILLNGSPQEVPETTLSTLLENQGLGGAKVATAVNGAFIPATMRDDYLIQEGDSIEVLAPMQGG